VNIGAPMVLHPNTAIFITTLGVDAKVLAAGREPGAAPQWTQSVLDSSDGPTKGHKRAHQSRWW